MNAYTFFGITNTATGEVVELHKQGLSKQEQIEQAKRIIQSWMHASSYHSKIENSLQDIHVFTNDQVIHDEITAYIRQASEKRRCA